MTKMSSKTYYEHREEKARDELGNTAIAGWTAVYLAVLFLATLLVVPLARWNLDERPVPGLGELVRLPATDGWLAANRMVQERIDAFERQLEESSPLLQKTLPAAQTLVSRHGEIGNEQVYLGADPESGWLHFRPDVDYLIGRPFLDPEVLQVRRRAAPSWEDPPQGDSRPALIDLAEQLHDLGIRLLLVPVPPKAVVVPDSLAPEAAGTRPQNASFARWRRDLEAQGVLIFDTTELLREVASEGQEPFLRTDSHWSPIAVERVAAALARTIESLSGLSFESPERMYQRTATELEGFGDLFNMLRLPAGQDLLAPERVTLQQVETSDGTFWSSDERAEVLLLGDSFSNVFSDPRLGWGQAAGLAEQLAYHLGRPIDRLAVNDGGATEVRRRLAQDLEVEPDRLRRKKLVIYVFAGRELTVGDWQPVELLPSMR